MKLRRVTPSVAAIILPSSERYRTTYMSRRWYRHGTQVVFVGWEPNDQGFYLNIVELCEQCGGGGEVDGSDEICPGCGGEGVQVASMHPSNRRSHLSLDEVSSHLEDQAIPFPYYVRADLEEDQRTNAAIALHEYDLEIDSGPSML